MKALDRAIGYLNIKPRTKAQVTKYLSDKGYGQDEIDEAMAVLEEYHYIDDLNYAGLYFELGFDKGHGIARIRRELSEKGVDRDIIDEAFEGLEDVPDQFEMAMEAGRTIVPEDVSDLDYTARQKLQARIARRLATRGYTADIAYKVAKELTR